MTSNADLESHCAAVRAATNCEEALTLAAPLIEAAKDDAAAAAALVDLVGECWFDFPASGQLLGDLLEHVRAMQKAIVDYATKVSATVEEDEPETVAAAKEALRAIEQLREMSGRRGGGGAGAGAGNGGAEGGEAPAKAGAGEAGKEAGPK